MGDMLKMIPSELKEPHNMIGHLALLLRSNMHGKNQVNTGTYSNKFRSMWAKQAALQRIENWANFQRAEGFVCNLFSHTCSRYLIKDQASEACISGTIGREHHHLSRISSGPETVSRYSLILRLFFRFLVASPSLVASPKPGKPVILPHVDVHPYPNPRLPRNCHDANKSWEPLPVVPRSIVAPCDEMPTQIIISS